ncbi:MAG: DUF4139 domain-containing protein [Myxococcaceae bacterium]
MLMFLVLGALSAPVTDVTVYSDRARVVRSANVTLSGAQALELPLLPQSTDVSSVRLEATGADVKRVDLSWLSEDQLPTDEAKKTLDALQAVDDQLALTNGELAAVTGQVRSLESLTPTLPPEDALKPAAKLSSQGWDKTVAFVADQLTKLHARAETLGSKRDDLNDQRQQLAEKARLLAAVRVRQGWKVVAQVSGNGPAKLSLSYMVQRARWYPLYDLTLDPETSKVSVAFSGLVSQESGEDWSEAALVLSTAIPATATTVPKLFTWKIGEKERFIPTPTPMVDVPKPAPPTPSPLRKFDEVAWLRTRLTMVANAAPAAVTSSLEEKKAELKIQQERIRYRGAKDRDGDGIVDSVDKAPEPEESSGYAMNQPKMEPPAPPPPPPPAAAQPAPSRAYLAKEEVADVEVTSTRSRRESAPQVPTSPFSLSPPPAYVRPQLASNLPAMAAGGYDLAYTSLQKESIATGKGARRVALFAESWPVTVERKLYPALFPEAFLVAELKSPASQPMPAGVAALFVGADPAGTAQLKLVSPGESFTLPLGIDRALRPKRNVKVTESEEGVFSKTEVTRYEVTIEIANPYKSPVAVRVLDQYPLTDNKDVEILLGDQTPKATVDKLNAALEWRMPLPASKTTVISFSYTLKKPKGWKMQQWEVSR